MSSDQNTVVRLRQRLSNRKSKSYNNVINKNAKSENTIPEDPRKIDDLVNFIEGKEKKLEDLEKKVKKISKKLEQLEIKKDSKIKGKRIQEHQLKKEVKENHKQKENKTKLLTQNKQTKKIKAPLKENTNNQIKPQTKLQEHEPGCTCTCSKSTASAEPQIEKVSDNISRPAMLTIRRTMEPEPKVTIFVKGSTPDEDKLLYTIVDGELQLVDSDQQESLMTKTQRRKLKKAEKIQENQTSQQITMDNLEIINAEITRKILEQQNISLPPGISLTKIRKTTTPKKPLQQFLHSTESKQESTPAKIMSKFSFIEIETSKLQPATPTNKDNKNSETVK